MLGHLGSVRGDLDVLFVLTVTSSFVGTAQSTRKSVLGSTAAGSTPRYVSRAGVPFVTRE
jgi:hypothetical protein